jgi:hypothetical protein
LAVACALAEGRSEFADVGELRVKESDRIASIARELARAGIEVEQTSTGFCVAGSGGLAPKGGRVLPDRDHRIAMAGAVLGLLSDEETTGAERGHRHVLPDLRGNPTLWAQPRRASFAHGLRGPRTTLEGLTLPGFPFRPLEFRPTARLAGVLPGSVGKATST